MDDECVEELGRPISSLKVAELRDELTKRALIKTGNKKELIDRLRTAILRQSSSQGSGADQQTSQQTEHQLQQNVSMDLVEDQSEAPGDTLEQSESNEEQTQPTNYSMNPTEEVEVKSEDADEQVLDLQNRTSHSEQTSNIDPITEDNLSAEQPEQLNKEIETESEALDSLEVTNEAPSSLNDSKNDSFSAEQLDYSVEDTSTETKTSNILQDPIQDSGNLQESKNNESSLEKPEESVEKPVSMESSQEMDVSNQGSISLKRGVSELRSSASCGNKEKRRKWSAKTSTDTSSVSDLSQATTITGGISSQKLQELIEHKPVESNTKNLKQTTNSNIVESESLRGSKESVHEVEESQQEDTSGEAKSSENLPIEISKNASEGDAKLEKDQHAIEQEVEPTNVLLVQNLVRPFTLTQLKEVLTKHGNIVEDKFWTDKVKSKCIAMYESIEIAQLTKESLNGQQWPSSNPKMLKVSYSSEEKLIQYQQSELSKSVETNSGKDIAENGSGVADKSNKSITNRLGDRLEDGDDLSSGDLVKNRLGERVSDEVSTKSSNVNRKGDNSKPQELDDLFKKTESTPHLFWLPLTESQADSRQKERIERQSRVHDLPQKKRRSPPRHRSPIGRRSSPRRRSPHDRRSPPRYHSPVGRRTPPRRRSPIHRNSPPRGRSPAPIRRSPAPIHHSPGPVRRSPGLVRRSPGPIRRSPGPIRRSPGPIRRSPGPVRRSPGLMRRSPGLIRRSPGISRRSPGLSRRSPGLIRRSPGPLRRSPGPIRRSPAPIRGSSPLRRSPPRKRSPNRRRSPPRHVSPGRNMNYNSEQQRRHQRLDRLR